MCLYTSLMKKKKYYIFVIVGNSSIAGSGKCPEQHLLKLAFSRTGNFQENLPDIPNFTDAAGSLSFGRDHAHPRPD